MMTHLVKETRGQKERGWGTGCTNFEKKKGGQVINIGRVS